MFYIFFIFCCVGIIGSLLVYTLKYGIGPTSTGYKIKKQILEMIFHCNDRKMNGCQIVELGSGWGTLAFALARKFHQCKIVALEISPIPYLYSWLICRWFSYDNLIIHRSDFFHHSLSSAQIVICYLYPDAMKRLKIKFEQELSSGTYVISHTFAIPGWEPLQVVYVDDLYRTPIYLYCWIKRELQN